MKVKFIAWDWKEQPYIDWLNKSLQEVFNGNVVPTINEVDTNSDTNVVVISSEKIGKARAQAIYDRYADEEDPDPFDQPIDVD